MDDWQGHDTSRQQRMIQANLGRS